MDSAEFSNLRRKFNKTQKEMASLLDVSIKAVQSYEQGWRKVPPHIERQLYFLISRKVGFNSDRRMCWGIKKCPGYRKKKCPVWEFKVGDLCWFINGTICNGTFHIDWKAKMKVCRSCEIFTAMMKALGDE